MISCAECRERLYPDDPRVKSGRYNMSGCEHYCSKPQYYRDLEQEPESAAKEVVYRHYDMSQKDFTRLLSLEEQVKYLQGQVNYLKGELEERKRSRNKYKDVSV